MSRFAGKKKPFIFLILPLILTFIAFLLAVFGNINNSVLIGILIGIPYFIFAALIYGLHPAFVRTEKFFSKRGYENVVLEYEFIKKILFLIIILLTIVLIIIYSNSFSHNDTLTNDTLTNDTLTNDTLTNDTRNIYDDIVGVMSNNNFIYVFFSSILAYIAIAAFLRITTLNLKKDFRFYFAKGCCKIISGKNDEVEKMKYLFLLLTSYNKYLKRNLKIEINDIKKIYSVILYKDTNQQVEITKSICTSLEADRLKLARYLSSLQKISESDFYIQESLFQQLKTIGIFLAAVIPIIISIIQLINQITKPPS